MGCWHLRCLVSCFLVSELLLFLLPCCSRFAPDITTNGSFIASVARRLPASHSHLTGEVDGGVNWGDLNFFAVVSSEHGVRI